MNNDVGANKMTLAMDGHNVGQLETERQELTRQKREFEEEPECLLQEQEHLIQEIQDEQDSFCQVMHNRNMRVLVQDKVDAVQFVRERLQQSFLI